MTDQKPPAPADKPIVPQSTATPSATPAPVAPVAKPAVPPLPKPTFSVSPGVTPQGASTQGSALPKPPSVTATPTSVTAAPVTQTSGSSLPKPPSAPALPPKQGLPPKPGLPPAPGLPPKPALPPAPALPVKPGMPPAVPGLPAKPSVPQQPRPPQSPALPPRPPAPAAPGMSASKPGLPPRPAGAPAMPAEGMPPASTIRQAPKPLGAAGFSAPSQLPPKQGLPTSPGLPPKSGLPPAPGMAPKPILGGSTTASASQPKEAPLVAKPIPNGGPTPPAGQTPGAPKSAEMKKSPLRFLPIVLLVLLVLGVAGFLVSKVFGPKTSTSNTTTGSKQSTTVKAQTVITYWGLWETTPVLQQTLADFEAQNPGIKVNYQQQTYRDYRERLQAAIAGGKGPDVFRFHASWAPMLRAELSEMPATVYTPSQFQTTFFPIANEQLQISGKYVGVPLMYEGLALIYNKEIFNTANAQPPKTWAELRDLAVRLTIRDGNAIRRGGLAIGNASNVDNFSDILGLLMLQNGANPADPTSQKAQEAIQFYTDFYTKSKVWDASLPSSTVAFARGDAAMIIAPSWRVHEIMSQNPNLTIGVAPVPQLSDTKITWASYWAEGVSAQSKNKDASWKLLKYLSSAEALQKLHSDASKERSFGEIYPRVDMANMLADSPYAAAYLADAPYAKDWYMNSFTHDNGLNDQIIKYYEDAINAISSETGDAQAVFTTVAQGLLQILRQYNLTR